MNEGSIKTYHLGSLGETVKYFTHPCGLPVYVLTKKGFRKKYASYTVDFGSCDMEFKDKNGSTVKLPSGTAHFLEHKMFEQKYMNASELFARYGARDNAGTDYDNTSFYFECTDNFEKCLKILLGFITDPYITKKNTEKEKGIIIQEIKMYEDIPRETAYRNMMKGMYSGSYIKDDIAGSVGDVTNMTPEILMKAYETFYTPENSFLTVAGDMEAEEVMEMIDRIDPVFRSRGIIRPEVPKEPLSVNYEYISEEKDVPKDIFCIGFKGRRDYFGKNKADYLKYRAADIAMSMLGGPASPLFDRLYKNDMVNGSFFCASTVTENDAYVSFEGESDDPEKVKDEIQKELARREKEGFTKDEFRMCGNEIIGNLIKTVNRPESAGSFLSSYIFNFGDSFDYLDSCVRIKMEDVEEFLTSLCRTTPVLSLVSCKGKGANK